ncbi:MAG: glycosyltransferase family 2 protein [Xanthobacteraceae bacterium]
MPGVAILLCTFNGAKFLPAQLASYEDQKLSNWRVFASDDGSTDGTLTLLSNYQSNLGEDRVDIRNGPRKGFVANFLSLVCNQSITADYYAYSDQDDVWNSEKLLCAVDWLQQQPDGVPAMYCGRTRLIDDHGRVCGFSPLFRQKPGFRNALVQSIAGGNTIVFNNAARELLIYCGPSVQVPSHDWWTYLLTGAVGGNVFYDPVPQVGYRVHSDNVVGSNVGWINRIRRIRTLATGGLMRWTDLNVAALKPFRLRMTSHNRAVFDLFIESRQRGFIGRPFGFLGTGVYRQTTLGNLGLALAILARKI